MENQQINSDEISLSQLGDKIKGFFGSINDVFFNSLQFVVRNIIILIILLVAGIGLGTYLDVEHKTYNHKVIVMPNFNSVNYLYQEVERINAKIKEDDTNFLTQIGFKNPENIEKIEIAAIVDIYEFIDNEGPAENDSKFQLFKLISENGDMEKMLEDNTTSKYYKNHVITITTKDKATQEGIIDPLLKHFESNTYFKKIQNTSLSNLDKLIVQNDSIIKQIDGVVKEYSSGAKSSNMVFLTENTQVNELLNIKHSLVEANIYSNIQKIDLSKIVKENTVLLNIKVSKLASTNKVILPLLFLFLFVCIYNFRKYYKKEKAKRAAAIA
ncbi:hypothetical protein GR160_15170 [Flavobacterium sp. Sd200]|uniref:hypothetical protein n=1 Tax=Flavobacterium sp. Sd200 TaxID=2692211 RepID=UPI00136B4F4D|nr:hypothetical protein [Flavobacterium sp. Sd200]MXN92568.1 hypothetical protein [Flavobacterium sp. Sd200]